MKRLCPGQFRLTVWFNYWSCPVELTVLERTFYCSGDSEYDVVHLNHSYQTSTHLKKTPTSPTFSVVSTCHKEESWIIQQTWRKLTTFYSPRFDIGAGILFKKNPDF